MPVEIGLPVAGQVIMIVHIAGLAFSDRAWSCRPSTTLVAAGDATRLFPGNAVELAQMPSRRNPNGKPNDQDSANDDRVHLASKPELALHRSGRNAAWVCGATRLGARPVPLDFRCPHGEAAKLQCRDR